MAFPTSSSGNLVLSLKVALISTGVLSVAVILKLSVPAVTDFAVSDLPLIYTSVLTWLRPPYLYLVINCIIISIVASSKLQLQKGTDGYTPRPVMVAAAVAESTSRIYVDVRSDEYVNGAVVSDYVYQDLNGELGKAVNELPRFHDVLYAPVEGKVLEEKEMVMYNHDGEAVVSSSAASSAKFVQESLRRDSMESQAPDRRDEEALVSSVKLVQAPQRSDSIELQSPQRSDSMEFLVEKEEKPNLPVSARFSRRKSVKPNPEGKAAALGVSKPKRHDTLESTWKMITDGRPMPPTRHLKKSDTWESHVNRNARQPTPPPPSKMKNSKTLSEKKSKPSRQGSGKLRREHSPGQDELNRRVEAFIKKFNAQMRLQRQESLNQYQEMISRSAY